MSLRSPWLWRLLVREEESACVLVRCRIAQLIWRWREGAEAFVLERNSRRPGVMGRLVRGGKTYTSSLGGRNIAKMKKMRRNKARLVKETKSIPVN